MSTSTAKHPLLAITVISGASVARGGELVERRGVRMNRQQKHERHVVPFIPHAPGAL